MTTTEAIQAGNDALRHNLFEEGKVTRVVLTAGVHNLLPDDKARVLLAVKSYNNFTPDNDPHGEHEFGVIELEGIQKVFWKIDYFEDESMEFDANSTFGEAESDFINAYRLLTILLADEY